MEEGANQPGCDGFLTEPPAPARSNVGREGFSTTRWTMIVAAGRSSDGQGRMAMEELCRTYWYPLYAHVRRRGHSKEDAEDLTQSFFARLLEKNHLDGLSPERGRFRSFLLAALKHFLANEWDKSQSKKRGGGVSLLSLDWQDAESRYRIEPADQLSPDKLYDRAWALTLLERVLRRLERANEGNAYFSELKPCLTTERGAIDYPEVAARLGMSENALRVAVHRLRKQYRELLRAEISETLADPQLLDDELQALYGAFAD
jgi:RNA polymerase sigma factor (sigma-70 family)